MTDGDGNLFPGFEALWIGTPRGRWFAEAGGSTDDPPLLLHGFPQTHAMWHRVAPALAKSHRVICLDLKGYGRSDAPEGEADHSAYAKRTLGQEIIDLMERIGHVRFALVGHDRGARVGKPTLRPLSFLLCRRFLSESRGAPFRNLLSGAQSRRA